METEYDFKWLVAGNRGSHLVGGVQEVWITFIAFGRFAHAGLVDCGF